MHENAAPNTRVCRGVATIEATEAVALVKNVDLVNIGLA